MSVRLAAFSSDVSRWLHRWLHFAAFHRLLPRWPHLTFVDSFILQFQLIISLEENSRIHFLFSIVSLEKNMIMNPLFPIISDQQLKVFDI